MQFDVICKDSSYALPETRKCAREIRPNPRKGSRVAISGRLCVASPSQNFAKFAKNLTNMFSRTRRFSNTYCWWKKSCTSWYGKYLIIYKVLYIPGGAGILPSTVLRVLDEVFWYTSLGSMY